MISTTKSHKLEKKTFNVQSNLHVSQQTALVMKEIPIPIRPVNIKRKVFLYGREGRKEGLRGRLTMDFAFVYCICCTMFDCYVLSFIIA